MDPDKDVDGMHPVNMGRLALMMPGPVPATPGRDRGAARVLRDPGRRSRGVHPRPRHHPRSSARAAALAEALDTPTPPSPSCTPACPTGPSTRAAPASSSPPRACPASSSPSTSRPARSWSAGACATRAGKLLPDVDEACEEVAGAITPRVGGVGPTTIAMLFRNAIEAAERNVRGDGGPVSGIV